MKKYFTAYLAGRMSWIPQFNFPRFDEVAEDIRERLKWNGRRIKIISPAELDDPEVRIEALASPDGNPGQLKGTETWGDFLARDLKLIADGGVEGIIGLEEWWKSRGARTETFNARVLEYPLIRYTQENDIRPMTYDELKKGHNAPYNVDGCGNQDGAA